MNKQETLYKKAIELLAMSLLELEDIKKLHKRDSFKDLKNPKDEEENEEHIVEVHEYLIEALDIDQIASDVRLELAK